VSSRLTVLPVLQCVTRFLHETLQIGHTSLCAYFKSEYLQLEYQLNISVYNLKE